MPGKAKKDDDQLEGAYYAILPADVRHDSRLKHSDGVKILYAEVTALCKERGFCWASNKYFARRFGRDVRTISRWVGTLERLGYIRTEINKKKGNARRIYLSTNLSIPIDKNVYTPTDKNIQQINIDNNTIEEKLSNDDFSPDGLSKAGAQRYSHLLLLDFGVNYEVANSLVYKQHTPLKSIEETIKNGLAKQEYEPPFKLKPGYIVKTLNAARAEVKMVKPTKWSKKVKFWLEKLRKPRKRIPWTEAMFQEHRAELLEQLREHNAK